MDRTLTCRSRPLLGQRGFALIELMATMVVIGLIALLVVPHMARSDGFQVQGAARMVASDLVYAQSQAVAHQQVCRVVFDVQNNTYRLEDGSGQALSAAWLGGAYVVGFGDGSEFPHTQLHAADFGGSATVSFDETGAPSAGGTVEVQAGGQRYQITLTAFTGRTQVTAVTGP